MRFLQSLKLLFRKQFAVPPQNHQILKATTLEEAGRSLSRISGQPLRHFSTRDFGREEYPEARSVIAPDITATKIVDRLRPYLSDGLLTFVGCTNSLSSPPANGTEIVVASGNDQFDILRIAQSNAYNYDMETEDLIRKLRDYDAAYGIDVFHAETDTIEFRLRTMPQDLAAFAEDVYQFCPDIVDQGVGSVEALQEQINQTRSVFLWWD